MTYLYLSTNKFRSCFVPKT